MKISIRLKKARKNKKLTQEYVASQINVSRKTISSWENGRGQPNSAYLKQLNSIYDTNLQFHYTQNKHENNNKYFYIVYFINLILFILCLINIFTGFLKGIILFQLLILSFYFINYRKFIFSRLKNEIKNIAIFLCIFVVLFGIIMNNLGYSHTFSNLFKDLPLYLGAFLHSLILTFSFFIITNYRNGK